ncbi:unnamed protein product, partial [Urochloa humidicola]
PHPLLPHVIPILQILQIPILSDPSLPPRMGCGGGNGGSPPPPWSCSPRGASATAVRRHAEATRRAATGANDVGTRGGGRVSTTPKKTLLPPRRTQHTTGWVSFDSEKALQVQLPCLPNCASPDGEVARNRRRAAEGLSP